MYIWKVWGDLKYFDYSTMKNLLFSRSFFVQVEMENATSFTINNEYELEIITLPLKLCINNSSKQPTANELWCVLQMNNVTALIDGIPTIHRNCCINTYLYTSSPSSKFLMTDIEQCINKCNRLVNNSPMEWLRDKVLITKCQYKWFTIWKD